METKGMSRRDLFRFTVAGGVTAAVGLTLGEGGPRAATADDTSTPDGALQALVDGNARFLAHNMTSLNEDQNLINSGIPESHQPFATILRTLPQRRLLVRGGCRRSLAESPTHRDLPGPLFVGNLSCVP